MRSIADSLVLFLTAWQVVPVDEPPSPVAPIPPLTVLDRQGRCLRDLVFDHAGK